MHKKFLMSLLVLSLAGAAAGCDDDEPLYTKDGSVGDAGGDSAKPDSQITDTGAADTAAPKPDATLDAGAPDSKADVISTPDVQADLGVPHLDGGADATPDATPDGTVDVAPDTTVVVDTGPDTTAPVDTAPLLINNCTVFSNGTGTMSDRYINWDLTVATADERCLEIKLGQSVTFGGDFGMHPLAASGGDTPAIPAKPTGSGMEDYTVPFNTLGTFGFHCTTHPTTMLGAIHVIP